MGLTPKENDWVLQRAKNISLGRTTPSQNMVRWVCSVVTCPKVWESFMEHAMKSWYILVYVGLIIYFKANINGETCN
jgi:hypothetical protein